MRGAFVRRPHKDLEAALKRLRIVLEGSVYFIESEDGLYVKIGRSRDVCDRFRTLRTANPGIRLLGALPEMLSSEKELHARFLEDRHKGEWFKNSEALREFIKTAQLQTPGRLEPTRWERPGCSMAEIAAALPARISTGKGQQHKVELLDATLPQLLVYRRTLKQTENRKLKKLDELVALMRKHSPRCWRVTLGEVLEKLGQNVFEFAQGEGQ